MLHELLIIPAAITSIRGHVTSERDGRQDRERRVKALDELAGPNLGEMRGGPVRRKQMTDRGSAGNLSNLRRSSRKFHSASLDPRSLSGFSLSRSGF